MQKIKIEQLAEPKTFQGAKGAFQVFGIKTNTGWINGYYNDTTSKWKVGDEVEIIITEKAGKDGKMYKNFSLPKKEDINTDRLNSLEKRISDIEKRFEMKWAELQTNLTFEKTGKFTTDAEYNRMTQDYKDIPAVKPEDLPF